MIGLDCQFLYYVAMVTMLWKWTSISLNVPLGEIFNKLSVIPLSLCFLCVLIPDKCLFAHTFYCFSVFGYRLLLGQWQGAPQPHYSLLLSQTSTTATSPPFSFIYHFFSFPPPCLLESADGMFFQKGKDAHKHTHACAVELPVVDKSKMCCFI